MKTRTIAMAVLALADLTACGESGTPTDTEPDQVAVSTIEVTPATSTQRVGGTRQFTAILKDAADSTLTDRTVAWSSSDMAVATINSSSGLATGVAAGTVTITGTSEGKMGAASLTIIFTFGPDSTAERAALVALYNSTDGDNWRNNTRWLQSDHYCSWFGVTCSGGVTGLSLFFNNLTGSIPVELGNLPGLERLFLSSNNLTGSIPSELGNLPALADLLLSSNELTGSIPAELGELVVLEALDLSVNNLSGSIPAGLGNLTALRILDLDSNELSGSIPAELGNLTGLGNLNLDRNQLTGSIPVELGNLTNLVGLKLQWNQLSGSIPSALGSLTALRGLDLDGNNLTGSIPAELGNLTALKVLYLGFMELSGSIPAELGGLTDLRDLRLSRNNLSGPIPVELGTRSSLYLDGNQLSGTVPLPVAVVGGKLQRRQGSLDRCSFDFNPGLLMPDSQEYIDVDLDNDGFICFMRLGTPSP